MPVCAEREKNMNMVKGDQKHLTLSQRIEIEKGLNNGLSFAEIARKIEKDPSTISKEVRKHRVTRVRNDDPFAVPCSNRNNCDIRYLCPRECAIMCKACRHPDTNITCHILCKEYKPTQCSKINKSPYVCNSCLKRTNCLLIKMVYVAKYADDTYREVLISSREGINQTAESMKELDELISPLIQRGQSIAHIYSNHAQEIKCSRRTLYTYIDKSVFSVRNLDLRRRVKYKPRKKATKSSIISKAFRDGRTYDDFLKMLKENPLASVVEMDTVEGSKGGKVLLTMMFRKCSLMLIFLMDSKTQEEVKRVFDELTAMLGLETFKSLFPVILTDNGSEFQDPHSLEYTDNEEMRTKLYFCNPHSSWQKGMIEKNHEYIRFVLPKGKSFDKFTQKDFTLLANHINSEARDSLNGCNPYQLSLLLLNNQLHANLQLQEIEPDEVTLVPDLLK